MAKTFFCRLGIAQISANPAYADELISTVQEPAFPGKDEKVGLFTIAGLEEINALRQKISDRYISHLNCKLEALIRFAAGDGVELLVLPEYSVPPESLPVCRKLSDELGIALIAGSHVVTLSSAATRVYKELGLLPNDSIQEPKLEEKVRQAVCVVFLPSQKPFTFSKYVRSKWEASIIPATPAYHSFQMQTKAGKIEVQVLICIEAISENQSRKKEKHSLPRLIAIPAFTPTCDPFYQVARLSLFQGKCTLFANIAEYGGSRVFARAENANLWFTQTDGTAAIPRFSEAFLSIEVDLEKQFEIRKSTREHTAVSDVKVYPFIYPANSPESAQYLDFVGAMATSAGELRELGKRIQPFIPLTNRVFPKLLQDKLQHFVGHVVPAGIVTQAQARKWIQPVIIPDVPSTDTLRWELCSEAIDAIAQLQLSAKYVEKTKELIEVYGHLLAKRNELLAFIQPQEKTRRSAREQMELPSRLGLGESPFIDRDHAFDRIRGFMKRAEETVFILSGMKGIGKSALIQEAFRQVIPPRRTVWLQLTEGISYPRLLTELASRCNIQMPEDLKLSTPQKQEEIEQKILAHLCQGPGAIVVIDQFQYLLSAREFEDPSVRRLFHNLLCGSRDSRSKFFLLSHVAPQLGPEVESHCSFYTLQGLSTRDTERLLLYWFQFGREDLRGHFPSPSERFLSLLGGHPLATRVAGRLWADHPSDDISQDLAIFRELRDTIVSFILEKISLSTPETEFLSFASVFRLPAPREVFLRWRGQEASDVLNALASQYLVESSERGYQLHPLVRDFFYNRLSTSDAAPLHKIAGKFYMDQFEKLRSASRQLVPEYLGEAIHHYLAAGERARVQSLAFYKQELKPVALLHYRKGDYKASQKDYSVLVQLDDSDVDAHFHLALIHARNGKWGDAELHFGKAITLRPKAPWILQGFANAKIRAGKLAEAEQLLEEAEAANPYHSPTLAEFGRLREKQGDSAAAEDYYGRAIQADPDNAYAYYMLASLLYREGELAEAYEMAKAALVARPLDERNKELVKELRKKVEEANQ